MPGYEDDPQEDIIDALIAISILTNRIAKSLADTKKGNNVNAQG